MKQHPKTPKPIAVPKTPEEEAALIASIYQVKVPADVIARELTHAKAFVDDDLTKGPAS